MRRTHEPKLIPCDHDAPKRCPVEDNGRWYTREWKPGEKVAYKEQALMKPSDESTYRG